MLECQPSTAFPQYTDVSAQGFPTYITLEVQTAIAPEILGIRARSGLKQHFPFLRFAVLPVPAGQNTGSRSGQGEHSSAVGGS